MIKLIIFDLDGVLADARDLHYEALNRALAEVDPKYVIGREEHLSTYDGLPTTNKLAMLSKNKGFPLDRTKEVWQRKQDLTQEVIKETQKPDFADITMMRRLKDEGYEIHVASNAVRGTVTEILYYKELGEYVDCIVSNEDVRHAKPNSEMYLRCMLTAGVNPVETVIVEDSHIGREAVLNSGAHLCAVTGPEEVTYDKVRATIDRAENKETGVPKWQGGNMNVLIPMAGAGKRFQAAGYTFPKPLIDVEGKPMIQRVVENLNMDARHIFIVQKEHYTKYALGYLLPLISPGCTILEVDNVTEGAACTALLAKDFINNDDPLLIANSDQLVEWDSNQFMYSMVADGVDGGMPTFTATHPKWSFSRLGPDGFIEYVAEKQPITDIATVGIYYWKHGKDFVRCAEQMIERNIRTNGEFYICPVYNEFIPEGAKIKRYHVETMHGLGTPEDLEAYLNR